MRFLDVCRNPDAADRPDHPVPYLLVVQGDHIEVRSSRVVVPLVRAGSVGAVIKELMPIFTVADARLVMMTTQVAGIATSDIGAVVGNLRDHHVAVRRAIDVLTGDL